jgi:hypothetical protein
MRTRVMCGLALYVVDSWLGGIIGDKGIDHGGEGGDKLGKATYSVDTSHISVSFSVYCYLGLLICVIGLSLARGYDEGTSSVNILRDRRALPSSKLRERFPCNT